MQFLKEIYGDDQNLFYQRKDTFNDTIKTKMSRAKKKILITSFNIILNYERPTLYNYFDTNQLHRKGPIESISSIEYFSW